MHLAGASRRIRLVPLGDSETVLAFASFEAAFLRAPACSKPCLGWTHALVVAVLFLPHAWWLVYLIPRKL